MRCFKSNVMCQLCSFVESHSNKHNICKSVDASDQVSDVPADAMRSLVKLHQVVIEIKYYFRLFV